MGHRTLVAYERDGYDLHYSHWGVDPGAITATTPYGGPPAVERVRECAAGVIEPVGGRATEPHGTAVDPNPLAAGLTFGEVCARIDPVEHEALYVVTPAFDVRRYLAVALRTHDDRRRTALIGYGDADDERHLRGWLAGARAVRDVTDGAAERGVAAGDAFNPVVAALRWLDPARGTVVFPAGEPER